MESNAEKQNILSCSEEIHILQNNGVHLLITDPNLKCMQGSIVNSELNENSTDEIETEQKKLEEGTFKDLKIKDLLQQYYHI